MVKLEIDDFIKNPTRLSQHIVRIANAKQNKYSKLSGSKKFLGSVINGVKIRLLYLEKYNDIYECVKKFRIKHDDIPGLFSELEKIFDHIALNNFLLAYAILEEKEVKSSIITKEDEKLILLSKLANNRVTPKQFKERFGHYALNGFELASRRFNEYSASELKKLARHLDGFRTPKKISLKSYLRKKDKKLYPVYSALREELKYVALKVISQLRKDVLRLKVRNVFNMSYKELKGLQ